MEKDDKGGINWMRDRLYSRNNVPEPRKRRKLRPDLHQVSESWDDIDEVEAAPTLPEPTPEAMARKKKKSPIFTYILVGSFLFFLVSAGISGYLFVKGPNEVSARNIDIEISGPVAVPGGEELALQIGIVNRNAVPLEVSDLIVDYPDGTRSALDASIELPRHRESLGTINPGERKKVTIRSVLFGEEDSEQNINMTLEYQNQGSNAVFFKEKPYNVLLSSAPVALTIDTVTETSSGQEVIFNIKATSNSKDPVKDLLVVAEYPFGFQFTGSDPEPFAGETVWSLGDMQPGESQELVVRGILVGQDTEDRIFRFDTGIQDKQSPTEIAAVFHNAEIPITIERPFIKLGLTLAGNSSEQDHVIRRGEEVSGNVTWANTLDTTILDGVIEVKLTGAALDRESIDTNDGFYRSVDDTIVWSSENIRDFASIEPGDSGAVDFSFAALPVSPDIRLVDPTMRIEASVRGRRISEGNVPEAIESSVSRNIKIASDLILTSQASYSIGPFENSGPVPPRVEKETTYTITWSVANTSNDMTNVRVAGRLPSFVTWNNLVNPVSADVVYNPSSRELLWDVGDVPTGTGYTSPAKELSFKVSLLPSLSQVGDAPELVTSQQIVGLDLFTNTVLETTRRAVTTKLTNDPGAPGGVNNGVVAR